MKKSNLYSKRASANIRFYLKRQTERETIVSIVIRLYAGNRWPVAVPSPCCLFPQSSRNWPPLRIECAEGLP